jgi:pimeloyl-ACP methyl ester carboxylesterase
VTGLVADVTGRGPAVVLLHGQPGNALDWSAVAARLRSDFTVIVPDRPGYGRTGGRAVGFAANAAAVVALLDRLDRPAAVVAGHSWAGGIALAMAEAHPQRVAGLVLIGSVGPGDRPGIVDRLLAVPPIGRVLASLTIGAARRALSHPAVRAMVDRRITVPTPEQLARAWRSQGLGRSFAIEQQALLKELPALAPALDRVRVPSAVVFGTADHIVSPATAHRLAAALPDAILRPVAGGGHLLPYEHPEVVAEAVFEVSRRGGIPLSPAPAG